MELGGDIFSATLNVMSVAEELKEMRGKKKNIKKIQAIMDTTMHNSR